MKVLMLNSQVSGVGHYRHWIPARALERAGIEVTYFPYPTYNHALEYMEYELDGAEKWLLANIKEYSIVHVGYSTVQPQVEISAAMREYAKIPVVVDLDDDIYSVPTYNRAFAAYRPQSLECKIAKMHLRIADAVSTSTVSLATLVQRDSRRVVCLPNCHEPWPKLPTDPRRHEDESIRFMFAGGIGRYGDLKDVEEAFTWAMKRYDGTNGKPMLRLFFLACLPDWAMPWIQDSKDPSANRVFYIRPCLLQTYQAAIRWLSPDVYFSPVVCNEFNKSKSHIKAYDAAECGAAFLCTDWDTYSSIPTSCAVKVRTTYEWKEAIEQLIEDSTLRAKLASRLKEYVYETWHIDKHIHKWLNYYEEVIRKGPISSFDDIVHPTPPVLEGVPQGAQHANSS